MAIAKLARDAYQYVYNTLYATTMKAKHDEMIDVLNAQVVGSAGFLTADAAGRAVMASGYFTEATATDKFAAQAITGALIKNLGVDSAQIAAGAVTEPKMAASILTGKHMATTAAGNTIPSYVGEIIISVADGSTVLDAVTLDATYGKIQITDVIVRKSGSTGGATDAVQLCTDAGGTTAITSSLALNAVAAGGIVRTTSITNGAVAAGAHLYVKRTHTTDCAVEMNIRCRRVA